MSVTTNHHWRPFLSRLDVPTGILVSQFDWTDADFAAHGDYSDGFICYRNTWYHLGDFMRGGVDGWHGSHANSFFSGVLIRLSDDGEEYQIGTWLA